MTPDFGVPSETGFGGHTYRNACCGSGRSVVARVLGVPCYRRVDSHSSGGRNNNAGAALPERQISNRLIALWIRRRYNPPVTTEFLDRLASQLKIGKSADGRRAVERILNAIKKDYENGKYQSPADAEREFRQVIEREENGK